MASWIAFSVLKLSVFLSVFVSGDGEDRKSLRRNTPCSQGVGARAIYREQVAGISGYLEGSPVRHGRDAVCAKRTEPR